LIYNKNISDFQYLVCDLSRYDDDDIIGAVQLHVALLLLKHIFDADWSTQLPRIVELLYELSLTKNSLEYVEVALRYLTSAAKDLPVEDLEETIEEVFSKKGGALMSTIAERWVEQGLAQGLERGLERGMRQGALRTAREALLDVLEARFGHISAKVAAHVAEIDNVSYLKALVKRVATVSSLSEFALLLESAGDDVSSTRVNERGISY
jgi:hypothetical protein